MNAEIVERLEAWEDQEKMIRRVTVEAVKSSAGAAVVMELSKRHLLPQQPPEKPQLSDEEQTRLSADKEEKSK
jgi:hypothetical protein